MDMFDQQHVRKLIERYGDDYEVGYCYLDYNWQAMFRDIKLNVDQWSVGQIKRKCALYKKLLAKIDERVAQKKEKEERKKEELMNKNMEEDESLLEE